MGWRFEIKPQLDAMNVTRQGLGKAPLTLEDVALLTGMNHKSLLNLTTNSTLRATNTRFIDALCAFFCCDTSQIMTRQPVLERNEPDHDAIDGILSSIRRGEAVEAEFSVESLYSEGAQLAWRAARTAEREEAA